MRIQITKTIYSTDRKERVHIVRRDDGYFGFVVEYFSDDPVEMAWIPQTSRHPVTICESEQKAELEARSRIDWLIEGL